MKAIAGGGATKKRRRKSPAKSSPPRSWAPSLPGGALHTQQRAQHAQVRRTEQKAVSSGMIAPRVQTARLPTKKHYTDAERQVILAVNRRLIAKQSAKSGVPARDLIEQGAHLADRETRRQLHKYQGAGETTRLADVGRREIAKGSLVMPLATGKDFARIGRKVEAAQRRQQQAIAETLSNDHVDEVVGEEVAKKFEGPRMLPGTKPGETAVQAGMTGAATGPVVRDAHQEALEKAQERIAREAFRKGATVEEVNKALMSMQTRHKAAGLKILEQLTRPISGVAGAAKQLGSGNPVKVAKGFGKGVVSNKESFTRILRDAGAPEVVTLAGGLFLDIALDPTTYLTAGVGRPALEAARKAAIEAASEAAAKGLNRAAIHRAAKEAADAAWAAHGLKGKGLKIGLRGMPVRAVSTARNMRRTGGSVREAARMSTREVSSSGATTSRLFGSPIHAATEKVLSRAEAKAAAANKTGWAGRVDRLLQDLNHSHRPREFSHVEWDMMTSGAREYRAAMGLAERMGERRMQAYRDFMREHDIPADRHSKIIDAIEYGQVAKLPERERDVARQMQADAAEWLKQEHRAGVRGADEAIRERTVDVPPKPDVKQSQKDLAKARRAAARAEKEARTAEHDLVRAQQNAENLSYNVAGVRGGEMAEALGSERKLAARRGKGSPADVLRFIDDAERDLRYAGGGLGVKEAKQRLAAAEKARADALSALRAQRKDHETVLRLAQEERAARARAEQLASEAKGYVARVRRGDLGDRGVPHYRDEPPMPGLPGGRSINSTSTKARKEREPLSELDPERRAAYVQDIPQIMGERSAESIRLQAVGEMNDLGAGLGRRIESPDDLNLKVGPDGMPDPYDMQRFYVRTRRGELKPAFRVVDTTAQLDKRLRSMIEAGEEVIEVPHATLEALWDLARRGRRPGNSSRRGAGELGLAWDEATRVWKWVATQPNPGYHARNLMGDLWNARIGGATLRDVGGALKLLTGVRHELDGLSRDMLHGVSRDVDEATLKRGGAKKFYKGIGSDLSDAHLVLLAERLGVVRMGFAGSELRSLRQGQEIKERTKVGNVIRSFSEGREDLMRLASFTRALRRGMDPQAAANWANKHHFDYSDLTSFETGVLRRVIPFYTFLARNTPLQLASLVWSPGRFANFEKVRNASAEAAGIDPKWLEKMPAYLQAQLPFAVPRGIDKLPTPVGDTPVSTTMGLPMLASPMLPITDINNIDVANQLLPRVFQSITPFVKLPVELWSKYDFYYRDKVRKDLVPAPKWMESEIQQRYAKLLGIIPGVGTPTIDYIRDRRTGKRVIAWPWWMDKLVRSTPLTGMVAGVSTEGRERRPGDRALTAMNWLTGVRRAAIDPNEARNSALFERLDEIDTQEQMARDRSFGHKPGEEWRPGSLVARLGKEKQDIYKELNKATGDWAVPYFPTPPKKKKGSSFPYSSSGGGGRSSGARYPYR